MAAALRTPASLAAGAVLAATLSSLAAAAAAPGAAGPAASAADTTRLVFVPAPSAAAPLAMHVLADTVDFGARFAIAWDLPAGAPGAGPLPEPADPRLAATAAPGGPWWRRGGNPAGDAEGRLAALPPAPGPRVVAWYRAYAVDSFRLAWQGKLAGPVVVRGRVEDPSSTAAVRDPRALPWLTARALLLLPVLLALVAAAWWWRRRRRPAAAADWRLPEPAWMEAAPALKALLEERLVETGRTREFLDRLAGQARRFAAAHYRIPAADLTGPELAAACAGLGHLPARAAALSRLLDEADLRRYDPEAPLESTCRDRLRDYLECLAEGRVEPRQTPVAAARRLAADQAWAELARVQAGLGRGPGRGGGE